jgi:hypothetical protein
VDFRKHIMVRGNPAVLLWINHKAKKIWKKKYGGQEGKYKKAHKEAVVAYSKKHPAPHLMSIIMADKFILVLLYTP